MPRASSPKRRAQAVAEATKPPRTDAKCWPFPCRDYHETYAHTSGEAPCECDCHPPRSKPCGPFAGCAVRSGFAARR